MIGKIVDKGTIKSLDNALHLKKYKKYRRHKWDDDDDDDDWDDDDD